MAEGPLRGVLVLDLSRAVAGPHAGMMLADLGARVIKIETPHGGDDSRGWGPPFVTEGSYRESSYFLSANRDKESLTLDLKTSADREVLTTMIQQADVLIENFRIGVLDRLGFSKAQLSSLNSRLVVLSITGFGPDGPEASRPGYDQIAQGEGGLMSLTGSSEPTKVGVPIADLLAGMNGAYGVVAALYERDRTGRGRLVHTSLLASVIGAHSFQGTRWTVAGQVPGVSGDHHASIAPYGIFATATDPVQVACGSEPLWRSFAAAVGLESADPRYLSNDDRVNHRAILVTEIELIFASAAVEHWLAVLSEAGVPAGRVRTLDQVYDWEQTRSQGLLIEVEHPLFGPLQLPGSPLRFDDNDYSGGRLTHEAPPTLGQHSEAIRAEFGTPAAGL